MADRGHAGERLGLSVPETPAKRSLYYRLGLVASEVAQATDRRVSSNIAQAARTMRDAKQLADVLRATIERCTGTARQHSGPRSIRDLKDWRALQRVAKKLEGPLPSFLDEHGAQLWPHELEPLRQTFGEFFSWLPQHIGELETHVNAFKAQFAQELETDRDELNALADQWGVTEADGLT